MTLAQSPGRIHDAKQKLEQERTHFEVLIRISAYEALLMKNAIRRVLLHHAAGGRGGTCPGCALRLPGCEWPVCAV